MEPDSTTCDDSTRRLSGIKSFPFAVSSENLQLYLDIVNKIDNSSGIIESLQSLELIPSNVLCPKGGDTCCLKFKPARVVDRVQWVCEGCGTKVQVRSGTFFYRLQCSLLEGMQVILGWCEDADPEMVAQYFGVKPKVVNTIFNKLDKLAVEEQRLSRLGGNGSVVLAEMYPDCLNRLSPDTTDRPHEHRILMLADTNHIPTRYHLHVMKEHSKQAIDNALQDNKMFTNEVTKVIEQYVAADSIVVVGNYMPQIKDAFTLQNLLQHCDTAMQHFLCEGIWRRALSLCSASRELCAEEARGLACAGAVQGYLLAALCRLRGGDLYSTVLRRLAYNYTTRLPIA